MSEEQVQLYDENGQPTGTRPRSRVRAENLVHAATAVLVCDSSGRVLVHRRTDCKDVYPGLWDFAAGGVVGAAEAPYDAAVRELAEEVGISDVQLEDLGTACYGDEHTRYWGHRFATVWDGPVRAQPEEVAEVQWWALDVLLDRLHDPDWGFVPDTVALLGEELRRRRARGARRS